MSDNLPAPILPALPPKAGFRKWLRSLPPDEVVAERWGCRSCPIANWLIKSKLALAPYVRPDDIAAESAWRPGHPSKQPVAPLPIWANFFGLRIDELGRDRGRTTPFGYGSVTAADCLAVLRRTPRG